MKYGLDYYQSKIAEAEKLTDFILKDFYEDCPNLETIEESLASETYKIPFLDAKYKRYRNRAQKSHDEAVKLHAKVSLMAREYYLRNTYYTPEEYADFGWTEIFKRNSAVPQNVQTYIDADDVYQAVTQWLAITKKNVEIITENIKSLVERGRQLKTALEHLKYKRGIE